MTVGKATPHNCKMASPGSTKTSPCACQSHDANQSIDNLHPGRFRPGEPNAAPHPHAVCRWLEKSFCRSWGSVRSLSSCLSLETIVSLRSRHQFQHTPIGFCCSRLRYGPGEIEEGSKQSMVLHLSRAKLVRCFSR